MAKAFGEQNPTLGEDPVSWQTWSDGEGGIPNVVGNADWGKLSLQLAGAEGRSAVYDLGSTTTRKFTLTENRYGTGENSATLQIRGDTVSFSQNDAAPAWENYSAPINRDWRYVQTREITNVRIAMWVWPEMYQTLANCNAIVTWATGRITDLYLMAMDYNASPCVWLGNATLGDVTATRVSGVTPFTYMINEATAAGIKVHAWLWMCDFNFWGSTTGLMTPDIPKDGTYNDGEIWKFQDATARTKLSGVIADFVDENPGISGINFDFEATTANITAAHMTSFLTEIRDDCPGMEFSVCTGASIGDDTNLKQDMATWMTDHLIDGITMMGYYINGMQEMATYHEALPTGTGVTIYAGIGSETNSSNLSDIRFRWVKYAKEGIYNNFCLFVWGNSFDDSADVQEIVDDWLDGTIFGMVAQGDITTVSVTPGTSFTVTVDGVAQTTNYADVSDHLYAGPLKNHVEAAVGSENPAIKYYRLGSAATTIMIGDTEL